MADIFDSKGNIIASASNPYSLNAYFKNRVKYHAASRLASQTGEGLAQALNVDGHTVTYDKVWTAPAKDFPNNSDKANVDPVDATNDIVEVFKSGYALTQDNKAMSNKIYYTQEKTGNKITYTSVTLQKDTVLTANKYYEKIAEPATSVSFWNGGKVWTNTAYPAVKLYEDIPMTPVKGSDGGGKFQSFEVCAAGADEFDDNNNKIAVKGVTSGTVRLSDWVSPTAVADRVTSKPVAGFSGIYKYGSTLETAKAVQAASTAKWAATLGTWEFVYMAGLLQFEPGYTPQDLSSASVNATTGETYLYLTAFKYDGAYLSDKTAAIEGDITAINGDITAINGDITAINGDITAITGDITTIEGDIVEINNTIADLTVQAGAKELLTINATIPVSGAIIGNGISGTVTDGAVSALVAGEVMLTKQAGAEITPDMSYVSGVTTLEADYGSTIPTSGFVWEITYRV